jgi:plasmid maintenance system antidote protein VapI
MNSKGAIMIFKNVKKAMIDQDLKLKDLAEIIGYTREYTSAVINGRYVSIKARKAITLTLGKDYEFLWEDQKTKG